MTMQSVNEAVPVRDYSEATATAVRQGFSVTADGEATEHVGFYTPEEIAEVVTNPLFGITPDFDDTTRPIVREAIVHAIEADHAQREACCDKPAFLAAIDAHATSQATLADLRHRAERSGL